MKYGEALADIVDQLNAAGMRATTEPNEVQTPGVLVIPGVMTFDYLDHENFSAQFDVYIVTSNNGTIQSINDLQDELAVFRTVFQALEAEPVMVPLPNYNDPVPGLLITLQATITKD